MTLNAGQQKAFDEIIDFLNSDRKVHNLEGGPGTGKSYLVATVLSSLKMYLKPDNPIKEFVITATTNQAVSVLQRNLPPHLPPAKTIYSFMNLRVKDNYSTGETECIPTARWAVHYNCFIVIDESSMVDRYLKSWIDKGTSDTCKVLYVGDPDQLPPVKEQISEVYSSGHRSSVLTESVRNKTQPALQALNHQLRETVRTGIFKPIVEVPGVIDRINGPMLQGILEREYHTEDPHKRVLAYTNKKVQSYNKYIRKLRGYTEPYETGEILFNNQSAEMIDKTRLHTDQQVRVISVSDILPRTDLVKGHSIECHDLQVEDVYTSARYNVSVFRSLQDRTNVLKHYSSRKHWASFFRIRDNFPDLRSTGATTTHKGQGGTHNSIIMDLDDIGKCTVRDQTARLMYVAGSRPKFHIYIKGELPERFYK